MKRTGFLKRSAMKRKVTPGSGIPQTVRDAVLVRDDGHCRVCGCWCADVPSSIHHRLPRGRGGDASPANLVLVCGDGVRGCHGRIESDRAQAYDDGWLIRTGCDPADTPALTADGWHYFTVDGQALTPTEKAASS